MIKVEHFLIHSLNNDSFCKFAMMFFREAFEIIFQGNIFNVVSQKNISEAREITSVENLISIKVAWLVLEIA